jgi:hypothetical protein
MRTYIGLVVPVLLAYATVAPARADEGQGTSAILDKALRALGGEERLGKVKAATWRARGKIRIEGKDRDFTSESAVQGLDQFREEMVTELLGRKDKAVAVLYGNKGYRNMPDLTMELDQQDTAELRRNVAFLVIPATIVPLKGKAYKLEALAEEKVGNRPAAGIKATGPDGKDFRIYFDRESGLPVKLLAEVMGVGGGTFPYEATYANYKDFGGIKKATKITIKRDGQPYLEQEITDFKFVDRLEEKAFLKPD